MDCERLKSRVKVAILMMDMDNWKDGHYPDDGEARKYANVAVDIIDAWCASQKASATDSALPISDVVGRRELLLDFIQWLEDEHDIEFITPDKHEQLDIYLSSNSG